MQLIVFYRLNGGPGCREGYAHWVVGTARGCCGQYVRTVGRQIFSTGADGK